MDYNPKSSPICTKLSPAMQCMAKYHICYGFWYSFGNSKNGAKKNHFLAFFHRFSGHAPWTPLCHAQIFCQMKVLLVINNRGKFHRYSICGCQVRRFQSFSCQKKGEFLATFGWFLGHNFRKSGQILYKFRKVKQTIILHHIYYGFWNSIENFKKISPKTTFLGIFRFLGHTLPRPKAGAKIFSQMEGLMEIHNPGKFHFLSICGCQVIYLQSFS